MSDDSAKSPMDSLPVRLARLYRQAPEFGLTSTTRELLKDALLGHLGGASTATEQARVGAAASPMRTAAENLRDRLANEPASIEPDYANLSAPRCEMRLRQLVQADVGFGQMEPFAWRLLDLRPGAEVAANVLELAFLHGSTEEMRRVIGRLNAQGQGFYTHVHSDIRAFLLLRLWREGMAHVLAPFLMAHGDDALLSVERLFVYSCLSSRKDGTSALVYFERHAADLYGAAQQYGAQVGLTAGRLAFNIGRIAMDLDRLDLATVELAKVSPQDSEYDDAKRLLLDMAQRRRAPERRHKLDLLLSAEGWQNRLTRFERLLEDTRASALGQKDRLALNDALKDPFKWIPEQPECWSQLAILLIMNRDLEAQLPNLLDAFRAKSLTFTAPVFDLALWQQWLQATGDGAGTDYWRSLGAIHVYAAQGTSAEDLLWQARAWHEAARKGGARPLPVNWRDIHRVAVQWVAKSPHLIETERARMLSQLRLAGDEAEVAMIDVEEYLAANGRPSPRILDDLGRLAHERGLKDLEAKILLRRVGLTHLRNADLDQLWRLSNGAQQDDLSWRIATVLAARGALCPQVWHAWEISGERRTEYSFMAPRTALLDYCLEDLAGDDAKLAQSCLAVGGALPELLALLDAGAKPIKGSAFPNDSMDARIEKLLDGVQWLESGRKRYRYSFQGALGNGVLCPTFLLSMPNNAWSSLFARVGERLGLNTWGWRLSVLHGQIEDLLPRLANAEARASHKVARWLRALSAEQRAGWTALTQLSKQMSDERALLVLMTLVARLALAMLQNHYQALVSLQTMRVPVSVIWDLERWMLSKAYADLRTEMGTQNRVPVPNALQRMSSILARG